MAVTLWQMRRPFEGFTNIFNDFDSWFDDPFTSSYTEPRVPEVDIEKKDGKYLLKADLPGMNKKDIHIELENGYLTLKGERKSEHDEKKDGCRRIEKTYGSFSRCFKVPEGLTEKDITAKYHDGVLELTIPTPKVEKPRAIKIKVE